jgi:hypothetical protein
MPTAGTHRAWESFQVIQAFRESAFAQGRQVIQAFRESARAQGRQVIHAFRESARAQGRQVIQAFRAEMTAALIAQRKSVRAQGRQVIQAFRESARAQGSQVIQAFRESARDHGCHAPCTPLRQSAGCSEGDRTAKVYDPSSTEISRIRTRQSGRRPSSAATWTS